MDLHGALNCEVKGQTATLRRSDEIRSHQIWTQTAARLTPFDKDMPNNKAATMTIEGPGPNLGTAAFSSNPIPTDIVLAIDEAIRKCDILLVRRRPMAAGRMINEPARSAPMNRNPTSMVKLKSNRK
jgi:hypothetical protein